MHIKHIITTVFKKHDIQDEKLALALNEILEAYYHEIDAQLARDAKDKLLGIGKRIR
ncbi:hypothetical protein [Bacillus thuringiensis]|uniref:hypothetical protein n=1 Tax=Bacillus thuringiensis TaxID=1428 RepID=UPI00159BBD5B|nr:hypothetical protein [Bacillus thuringiensis]